MISLVLIFAAVFLAFVNGANDNFKGVATLFGSNIAKYKTAINWATVATFSGSIAALFLAESLVKNFSGKGLVPDELLLSPLFAVSVSFGAALTVYWATLKGLPISTTHSLVGALFGSGLMAVGTNFNFARLGNVFLIPLIVSPAIAAIISILLYYFFNKMKVFSTFSKEKCICIGGRYIPIENSLTSPEVLNTELRREMTFEIANKTECVERYSGRIWGIETQLILDGFHFLSAGVVSFARGLNDTPKIVGLLLVINAFDVKIGLFVIGLAIAAGGLLKARKVGETVSKKITPMSAGQGFTANLVTGILVTTASIHGLPVSTTHISVGSIFGIGSISGKADTKTIKNIFGSWILTLPVATIFSAFTYFILSELI